MNYPDLATKVMDNDLKKRVFEYCQFENMFLRSTTGLLKMKCVPFWGRKNFWFMDFTIQEIQTEREKLTTPN
jgi:hypothetical protein